MRQRMKHSGFKKKFICNALAMARFKSHLQSWQILSVSMMRVRGFVICSEKKSVAPWRQGHIVSGVPSQTRQTITPSTHLRLQDFLQPVAVGRIDDSQTHPHLGENCE